MTVKDQIKNIAKKYSTDLAKKIDDRICEMKNDDKSHYLIYNVLGITETEGDAIDIYQNKGRFLYKYAGSFLEDAVILCMQTKFSNAQKKVKIPNKLSPRPKTVEIDCLIENLAFEIKWRDATTDGDHITKEHTRLNVVKNAGYTPIRLMFFSPNRTQAIKIQDTLKTIYHGLKGEYFAGDEAWNYIKTYTDIDLKEILVEITKNDK